MKIGINLVGLNPAEGGMYQYAVTFTRHLLRSSPHHRYVIFHDDDSVASEGFAADGADLVRVATPLQLGTRRIARWLDDRRLMTAGADGIPMPWRLLQGDYRVFRRRGVKLLIQPSNTGDGAFFAGLPYLIAIHDAPYQWSAAMRASKPQAFIDAFDLYVRAMVRRAAGVLVDSENGRRAMVDGYQAEPARVHVLSFVPPDYVRRNVAPDDVARVRSRYALPPFYLLFPTKFHSHKNHLGLLDALEILRARDRMTVPLILVGSGSNDDTFDRVMARIQELGMTEQVRFLGYVPDEDVAALYKAAGALVFPTFLGPTAIPILEAFAVGCPVICSNVEGLDEQVGDAGLLVDPARPESIADAIRSVFTDDALRHALGEKGLARSRVLAGGDYGARVSAVVERVIATLPT